MTFIVDANIVVELIAFETLTEVGVRADARLQSERPAAPQLLRLEVLNSVLMKERRGIITTDAADLALQGYDDLMVALDDLVDVASVASIVRRHWLTAYDATYLELAVRRALPLATNDRALRRAARAEGVVLV